MSSFVRPFGMSFIISFFGAKVQILSIEYCFHKLFITFPAFAGSVSHVIPREASGRAWDLWLTEPSNILSTSLPTTYPTAKTNADNKKNQSYPAITLTNREHIRLVFCLQNYNKFRNTAMNLKNNSQMGESHLAQSCFHYKSTIIPTNMPALPIFAEKLGHDRYGRHENN